MMTDQGRVCPVEMAGSLDNVFRRWIQNPRKILSPYIQAGMTVLDVGCGPGFFTIPMAQLVGDGGRVIAVDLQEKMLDKIRGKIKNQKIAPRIVLRQCEANRLGLAEQVDFVLLFYLVHEISHPDNLFGEIARNLKPAGQILMAEPPVHVSKAAFESSLATAETVGLKVLPGPSVFLSKTAILQKD